MQDKDISGMLRVLVPRATRMVLTSPPSRRAASPADVGTLVAGLAPGLPVLVEADPARALALAFESGRSICVAGSIYLLGAVLPAIAPFKRRA
jgi:folylpolyglutamate synthase/dihydropteroate synthase